MEGTHGWVEVDCTAAEQVVASQYAAVEDRDGDLGLMVVGDVAGVAAVVQDCCFAVGSDSIHLLWEEDSRSAVALSALPVTAFA